MYLTLLLFAIPIFAATSNNNAQASAAAQPAATECERSFIEIYNGDEPCHVTISASSRRQAEEKNEKDFFPHRRYFVANDTTLVFSHLWKAACNRTINITFSKEYQPDDVFFQYTGGNVANSGVVFTDHPSFWSYKITVQDQKKLLEKRPQIAQALALLSNQSFIALEQTHEQNK